MRIKGPVEEIVLILAVDNTAGLMDTLHQQVEKCLYCYHDPSGFCAAHYRELLKTKRLSQGRSE